MIISGGQTGGWAPKGWLTSDGPNPSLADYGLKEHTGGYKARTYANVKDSHGVLYVCVLIFLVLGRFVHWMLSPNIIDLGLMYIYYNQHQK